MLKLFHKNKLKQQEWNGKKEKKMMEKESQMMKYENKRASLQGEGAV